VVTGRIVERGDQLIVSAELIDARTNHNLWGDQYDRKLSDLLAVQQDITGAISAKLRERLSGEIVKQLAKGGTNNPEAYQLYLKGRYYWEKRTPETLQKAKDYFNQAIERDPNYALAYVGWRTITTFCPTMPQHRSPDESQAPEPILWAQTAVRHYSRSDSPASIGQAKGRCRTEDCQSGDRDAQSNTAQESALGQHPAGR